MRPLTEVLSVEAVKAAYEKTGLRPRSGTWGDGVTCGCPALVVAIASGVRVDCMDRTHPLRLSESLDAPMSLDSLAGVLDVSVNALGAFTAGFDGEGPSWRLSSRHATDYEHGYAVARAVFDLDDL